jgi:hypothetical protein
MKNVIIIIEIYNIKGKCLRNVLYKILCILNKNIKFILSDFENQ